LGPKPPGDRRSTIGVGRLELGEAAVHPILVWQPVIGEAVPSARFTPVRPVGARIRYA
jgi:hypothetical protein